MPTNDCIRPVKTEILNGDDLCLACPDFYTQDDGCDFCPVFLMYRAARLERGEANA